MESELNRENDDEEKKNADHEHHTVSLTMSMFLCEINWRMNAWATRMKTEKKSPRSVNTDPFHPHRCIRCFSRFFFIFIVWQVEIV